MARVSEQPAGQPIIVGAGLAGLMTALHLAPQPVVVLTKASLGAEAASGWAQGGIAAALGADDDAALHAADTLASGDGLAARAGAALADMEFVQFHPTALDVGLDPMPLVSEAVRGEGAVLIDETGARFMAGHGRAELEPRDVVARAVWRHLAQGHRVFLDARASLGPRFAQHFPIIAAACRSAGIDPARQPIPVRPAAHYLMGGIAVDAAGRSSVEGLWACGEAASTGLHGANRLASNSLLEAAARPRRSRATVAPHPFPAASGLEPWPFRRFPPS